MMDVMTRYSSLPAKAAMSPYEELMAYADECAANVRGWHGELIDADTILARHAIARDELVHLRTEGQVVGLECAPDDVAIYPAAQFMDDNVIPGICEVRTVVGIEDEAWLWLIMPSAYLDGAIPLDCLKQGKIQAVVEAAHHQYDCW